MELSTAVVERRTIRHFKSDLVPEQVIREIIEKARWAPSWANSQPWELYVVIGDTLERFKQINRQKYLEGDSHPSEIPMPTEWPDPLKKRVTWVGKSVLESLSITREDKEKRRRYYGDVHFLLGAPCMILVTLDKGISIEYAMLDVGLFMQTFCLLAHEKGLGTSMLAAAVRYPQVSRELLQIPDNQIIIIGTALGYPDWDSPVNHFKRERAELSEFVKWIK